MKKSIFILLFPLALFFSCKKESVDQGKIDSEIIHKYIKDSALVVDSTTEGLFYMIADSGVGTIYPNVNSYVYINYKGYLTNGRVFDYTSGTPLQSFLHRLIRGWQICVPKIRKGGKMKLLIPSALGYGSTAYDSIPANSVLIFDLELVNFQ